MDFLAAVGNIPPLPCWYVTGLPVALTDLVRDLEGCSHPASAFPRQLLAWSEWKGGPEKKDSCCLTRRWDAQNWNSREQRPF